MLSVFTKSFKTKDRRSINNGIFLGQSVKALPQLYDDFEGFGKLGVSSFKLNWDYSFAKRSNGNYATKDKRARHFEKLGKYLTNFSSDEIRLASCIFLNDGLMLNQEEKDAATRIKDRITEELQLL